MLNIAKIGNATQAPKKYPTQKITRTQLLLQH
jgi:hypothetical protein